MPSNSKTKSKAKTRAGAKGPLAGVDVTSNSNAKALVPRNTSADSESDSELQHDVSDEDSEVEQQGKGRKRGQVRGRGRDAGGDSPMEKDEAEEQLEKLLFGDDAGFRDALKAHQSTGMIDESSSDEEHGPEEGEQEDRGALGGIDDADLFFLDSGAGDIGADGDDQDLLQPETPSDTELAVSKPAAWEDSDDERITVSLQNNPRLRKLRVSEAEDVVSGKEYIRRLRRQFERLHPAPEWADPSILKERSAKRRKKDGGDDSVSEDSSADEMDTDAEEETSPLQPLAKLLQNTGDLTRIDDVKTGGKRKLRQETVDIQRLKDIGGPQPSAIDSLAFHPHYPLLLSSGPASTIFLHHVSPSSPSPNPLLTSLHLRRTPLYTSAFAAPTGNRIFLAGRRRFFHIWDLDTGKITKINGTADRKEEQKSMERFKLSPCGRYIGLVGTARKGGGLINVLDAETLQWIAQVRVDSRGGVADFAWWSDGNGMCVVGKSGEVSEWDGREKRVVARWIDEGAVGTTVLSLGGKSGRTQLGGDRWVAIGSSSGIVNIYDRRTWQVSANAKGDAEDTQSGVPRNPKPTRVLDQLTTPTSHLVFSADGQLLAMGSRWKKDAFRLIHLPSCTIYKNWPTSNTPLGRITSVAFSPTSDMLAIANEAGKIRLWQIHG